MGTGRDRYLRGVAAVVTAVTVLRLRDIRREEEVRYQERALQQYKPLAPKEIIHAGGPKHAVYIANDLREGSEGRFRTLFRMGKKDLCFLVDWLVNNAGLEGTRYQKPYQKVMVFLLIVAQAVSQRVTSHFFEISQSTVSEIFHEVLEPMQRFHLAVVRLPPDGWLDPGVELDPKISAGLSGCIGAIDGTHVSAFIRGSAQKPWFNRKGNLSQNVFAAVKSDLAFTYVLAGAEGSMNDSTLLGAALNLGFRIPRDRYYLADAGFGTRPGVVVPFAGVRYHLQDWREADRPPASRKELYNLRHSRQRVTVERAFGRLKRQWKIVRNAPAEYSFESQKKIIYAVTALHNLLIARRQKDEPPLEAEDLATLSRAREVCHRELTDLQQDYIRLRATEMMAQQYNEIVSRQRRL